VLGVAGVTPSCPIFIIIFNTSFTTVAYGLWKDLEFKEFYTATDNQEKLAIRDLPFVRNIENVQGEERDIIIFSLGYAKDLLTPEETFGIHFGSLNGSNGENYLNVAITRARQEIIIICSFDPDKINVDNATHTGPRRLKEYLCYAKSISESNHPDIGYILLPKLVWPFRYCKDPLYDNMLSNTSLPDKISKLQETVHLLSIRCYPTSMKHGCYSPNSI
jgi:hypothetical protein